MGDAEYLFNQTSYEAKRLARGAYAKKGGSRSKRCTLPSDKLTERQRKELNGKMATYNLSKPMSWKNFKSLPDDLKVKYIRHLIDDCKGRCCDVAVMFGITPVYLGTYLKESSLNYPSFPHTGKRKPDPEWEAFMAPDEPVAEPIQEPTEEPIVDPAPPVSVKLDTQDVVCRNGILHYIGKPALVFENAFKTLDSNKDYYISISFLVKEDKADASVRD